MKTLNYRKPAAPALFASVRDSRDLSLAAFAVALLAAFALHAGAFVPRLSSPAARQDAGAIQAATQTPAPVVASQPPAPCERRG